MKLTVTFIVLNWHSELDTIACIQSIRALRGAYAKHIIIVDNESTDESAAALQKLRGCVLIRNDRNEGFAGGVNSALPHIRGSYVALVNNDAVLARDWLEQSMAIMKKKDHVGAVGGTEFHWDATNPVGSVTNTFVTPSLVHPEQGYTVTTSRVLPVCEVAFLTGSNMLIPAALFKKLGGFDTDFFAYYEDADLSLRILAQGHRLFYSPHVHIWHKRNVSSNKVPYLKRYLPARNRMIFIAKHYPDHLWRRMIRASILDAAVTAVLGSTGGLRSFLHGGRRIDAVQRKAFLAAAWWGITHQGYLRRKRRSNASSRMADLPQTLHALQDRVI